jgi:hypothetical protein
MKQARADEAETAEEEGPPKPTPGEEEDDIVGPVLPQQKKRKVALGHENMIS